MKSIRTPLFPLCVLVSSSLLFLGGGNPSRLSTMQRTKTYPTKTLDINQLGCIVNSNGPYAYDEPNDGAGMEWPRGSGHTCVYAAGLWVDGIHRQSGRLRCSVQYYLSEEQPGPLLPGEVYNTSLNADSIWTARAADLRYRPYKVVRGMPNGNPALGIDAWTDWPGDLGAPFVDVNGNGGWDPGVDVPEFSGDEMIWCVVNDCSVASHSGISTSMPMGVEVQELFYAFDTPGVLQNTMYMKWKVINKSDADYDSVYAGLWSDVDLGDGNDDRPGCDTTLALGFAYNGTNNDAMYGLAPPADGFGFLVGPKVPGLPTDSAFVDGGWRKGYRNLPEGGFVAFINGTGAFTGPVFGDSAFPRQAFGYLRGLEGQTSERLTSPTTGQPTSFWLSGDPVAGTGDLPSNFGPGTPFDLPRDIRIMNNCGPFTLARGDTQEIIGAFAVGQGSSNLNSITQLRNTVGVARSAFYASTPIAAAHAVGPYEPIDSVVALSGGASVPFGTITHTLWVVSARPPGSSAVVADPSQPLTSITPDSVGLYQLLFIATASSGLKDTAEVEFQAVNNRPPHVAFSAPAQITLGDSIVLDGSAIADPDNDALTIRWKIDNGQFAAYRIISPADSSMGTLVDSSAKVLKYYPYRTSRVSVAVTVSDAYYTVAQQKSIVVNAVTTPNLQVRSKYDLAGLPAMANYYSLGPIREFNGQIWISENGSLFTPNFADNANPAAAFAAFPGNFWVGSDKTVVARGDTGVWVLQHGVGVRPLHPVSPVDTTVSEVFYNASLLLFSYGTAGIWAEHFLNPSLPPSKVGQYADGDFWGDFVVDGTSLYGLTPRSHALKILDISSPSTMALKKTVWLGSAYEVIKKYGNALWLLGPDTITVLDVSDTSHIASLGSIPVPATLPRTNRFYDVSVFGTYAVAGTDEGCYLYDITNLQAPTIYAKYITGFPHVSVFLNASRLLAGQWDILNPGTPERLEGLLDFQTPIAAVGGDAPPLPKAYVLESNYPNPFNPSTGIRYQVSGVSYVRLVVYDILGREVRTLVSERKAPGTYEVRFDGAGLSSGVYFYRMTAGGFTKTRKMVLVR